MYKPPRETQLHDWHVAHKATMMEFAGWTMPLWFPPGAVAEHQAVIVSAGIFDTSHMSVLSMSGPGAFDLLQMCFTKDLTACVGRDKTPLRPGKCVYGAFLTEPGEVIDDAIVFQNSPEAYTVVVNAGMGAKIAAHLYSHHHGLDVRIFDLTGMIGKIDLQGPMSAKVLLKVLKEGPDTLQDMTYFSFKGHYDEASGLADTFLHGNIPVLLSRTGYTGEFGFELFVRGGRLVQLWETVLHAGKDFGLIPCGLAARDSLRAGACLPLSHQDIGAWPFINHPWPFALPYNNEKTAFTKKFLGDRVLELKDQAEHTYPFVGYDPRKVSIHDSAVVLDLDGKEIGVVLTCVADMSIARYQDRIFSMASPDRPADFRPRGLCCGFVRVKSRLSVGQEVELKDNRRQIKVTIVDDIRPNRSARRPIREMMR
jgi:aminomethyltransferase